MEWNHEKPQKSGLSSCDNGFIYSPNSLRALNRDQAFPNSKGAISERIRNMICLTTQNWGLKMWVPGNKEKSHERSYYDFHLSNPFSTRRRILWLAVGQRGACASHESVDVCGQAADVPILRRWCIEHLMHLHCSLFLSGSRYTLSNEFKWDVQAPPS